jgi:hypothetical protein
MHAETVTELLDALFLAKIFTLLATGIVTVAMAGSSA